MLYFLIIVGDGIIDTCVDTESSGYKQYITMLLDDKKYPKEVLLYLDVED